MVVDELAPRSVQKYWQAFAQLLDYAELEPNPARHKTVRLPFVDVEEVTPSSTEHFLKIVEHLTARNRLPAVLLEQTAARTPSCARGSGATSIAGSRIRSRGVSRSGMPPGCPRASLAERMGHSKASMSLDVYTHVMPPDEALSEALTALLVVPGGPRGRLRHRKPAWFLTTSASSGRSRAGCRRPRPSPRR